jgi:hypothetical protein
MGFGFPTVLRRGFVLAMLEATSAYGLRILEVHLQNWLHLGAPHPHPILQMYHHRWHLGAHRRLVLLASLASTTT